MSRVRQLMVVMLLTLSLTGCGDESFENGGSSYATVSRDSSDACRVFVTDMGRARPSVKPFVARIEGCEVKP